jgi:hypothetical protein
MENDLMAEESRSAIGPESGTPAEPPEQGSAPEGVDTDTDTTADSLEPKTPGEDTDTDTLADGLESTLGGSTSEPPD